MDIGKIREAIPVTKNMIYMNTGWSGPSPERVTSRIKELLTIEMEQGPATLDAISRNREIHAELTQNVARLLNAPEGAILPTQCTTHGLVIVVNGMDWKPGDEIVTCSLEHPSVMLPSLMLQETHGVKVRIADIDPKDDKETILAKIADCITPNTRLAFFSHVQFSCGLKLPAKEVAQLVHEKGAYLLLDGAQGAGHLALDMVDMDCDFYAIPGQKWLLGPDGTGALYIREQLIPEISPRYPTHGAVFLILLFAPLPGDLSQEGQRVLAVVGLAVTIWITDLLSPAVTGILAIVLLVVLGGVSDIDKAVSGFGSPVAYFLIGILGLGIGVAKSGLAERVASMLIGWAKGNPSLLFLQMLVSFIPMTLLLPSATTRNAIQIPIYDRVLEQWQVPFEHPFGRAVTQGLGSLNRLASTALLTGGTSPVVAAALLGDVNWSRWLVLLGVPFYTLLAIGGIALFLWYRKGFSITAATIEKPVSKPWTGPEKRAAAIALLTAGLWFSDSWHGLHPAVPALTALVLLVTPRIGVLTWMEFERGMNWATFIVLATSLSLANAMVASGVARWLADGINVLANPVSQSPVSVLASLMLACGAIRLFIPSIVGYLAFTIPVAASLAEVLGYNPLVFGLAVLIVGDSTVFYPAAGTSGVMVYAKGNVSGPEIFRLALLMMVTAFVVILVVALPWWSLVGEPLVR